MAMELHHLQTNMRDVTQKAMDVAVNAIDEISRLRAENAELMQKLEDAKATAYAESVDAGMRERKLKRALYKACANWADVEVFDRTVGIDDPNVEANRWALMRNKCLKKAEEYK